MTTETFLFLVLAAGAAFLYWQKNKPNVTPAPNKAEEPPSENQGVRLTAVPQLSK